MTNTKLLLAIALPAIALLAAVPSMHAFAAGNGATIQSFNTGTMSGYAYSTSGSSNGPATASLSGQIVTNPDGSQNLSPLSGTITVGGQTGTVQFKPTGAMTVSSYQDWYCGTTNQYIQLGSAKTIGNGPAVKGIAIAEWSTSTNCGNYEVAEFLTQTNTGALNTVYVGANQSPLG